MPIFNHRSKSRRQSIHIHNIPSEILRHIFIATYPRSIFGPGSDVSSAESILLPRRLSHVCRRWREEALSFGELWSYLFLTEEDIKRNHRRTLHVFFTFLERANVSPLNFRFGDFRFRRRRAQNTPGYNEGELSAIETIISALLDQQHRWYSVDFKWADIKLSPRFRRIEIVDMPLVKNLSLTMKLTAHDGKDYPATIDLSRSSRIESLDLCGNYHLKLGGRPKYQLWKCQITTQVILSKAASAKSCSEILRFAPNCRRMVFSTIRAYEDRAQDIGRPVPHALKELTLRDGQSHEMVLDSLHLPELEKLAFGCGVSESEGRTLLNMVRRSRPPLTSLELPRIPGTTLLEILTRLPTLVELTAFPFSNVDDVFRALYVRGRARNKHDGPAREPPVLCPRLCDLRLFLAGKFSDEIAGALFTMLESRMMNLGTFNKAVLSGCNRPLGDVLIELSPQTWDPNTVSQFFQHGCELIIKTRR